MTNKEYIEVKFYIEDDVLFKDEPLGYNTHETRKIAIIPKDAFIACYEKWIKKGQK